jgi:hypothetical protein
MENATTVLQQGIHGHFSFWEVHLKSCADLAPGVDNHDLTDGLPGLCQLMSSDKVFAVLRRFDNLAIRNLVHLQTELGELERRLSALDEEDRKAKSQERMSGPNSWPHDSKAEMGNIVLQIREKIQLYRMWLRSAKI